MSAGEPATLHLGGHEVTISNPDKLLFPKPKYTKLDLVNYYVAVADGALRGAGGRPNMLVRFPNGIGAPSFYQKRAPASRPPWIEVVPLRFPSGRTADEVVPRDPASLAWLANLACLELHPHPVRAEDLDHPDELRVDLDPVPGIKWPQVRQVAQIAREVLVELGLVGWPKTSGSRGMHLFVRIQRKWGFDEVRRAALALAREVERRGKGLATSKWWKEERQGVFIDYNQNAKDRTVASAYSVRPTPDARVSTPLHWDEVPDCDPAAFTIKTVPDRFKAIGDPFERMDEDRGSLDALLDLVEQHEAAGFGDAPWPPQFAKQPGEPTRVQPSKARAPSKREGVVPPPAPGKQTGPTGRRRTTAPLIEIARAATQAEALEGLERWKAKNPEAVSHLKPADVMVDAMRGRFTAWYRIRVNLRNVPTDT